MTKRDWVSAEITRVYPDPESPIRQSITALMSTWQRMVLLSLKDAKDQQEVVEAFSALTNNRIIPDPPNAKKKTTRRVWAPAGQYYRVSSVARVRPECDASESGWKINAREGRIIGVRGGYMIIKFDVPMQGAPDEFRGRPSDFEVDISHLKNNDEGK